MLTLHIFTAKWRSGNLSSSFTIVPRQNPSSLQEDSIFPCASPELNPVTEYIFISFEQGGYHELQNEPDGVKEKLLEEVVSFIDDRLASSTLGGVQAETTNPDVLTESADDSAKAKM